MFSIDDFEEVKYKHLDLSYFEYQLIFEDEIILKFLPIDSNIELNQMYKISCTGAFVEFIENTNIHFRKDLYNEFLFYISFDKRFYDIKHYNEAFNILDNLFKKHNINKRSENVIKNQIKNLENFFIPMETTILKMVHNNEFEVFKDYVEKYDFDLICKDNYALHYAFKNKYYDIFEYIWSFDKVKKSIKDKDLISEFDKYILNKKIKSF